MESISFPFLWKKFFFVFSKICVFNHSLYKIYLSPFLTEDSTDLIIFISLREGRTGYLRSSRVSPGSALLYSPSQSAREVPLGEQKGSGRGFPVIRCDLRVEGPLSLVGKRRRNKLSNPFWLYKFVFTCCCLSELFPFGLRLLVPRCIGFTFPLGREVRGLGRWVPDGVLIIPEEGLRGVRTEVRKEGVVHCKDSNIRTRSCVNIYVHVIHVSLRVCIRVWMCVCGVCVCICIVYMWMCVYLSVYAWMCTCRYVFVCVHSYVRVCVVSTCTCMLQTFVYVGVRICVYMWTYVYVWVVCTYVYE